MRDLFRGARHYAGVPSYAKLFRATVVMGVSLTASCDSDKCHHCSPEPDPIDSKVADAKPVDAGVDAPRDAPPGDAPVDTVIII